MYLLEMCTVFIAGASVGAFGNVWLQRYRERAKRKKELPALAEEHEFLEEASPGRWEPLSPPQYVPAGEHPTAASWRKFHETGRHWNTRRIGDE